MDGKKFLTDLKTELDKNPDIDGLRAILDLLDDAGTTPGLLDYVALQNDRADLKNMLTAIRRLAEDRAANRNTRKLISMAFTGAGISTMVGSFAVVASLATGFFVVPLLVGGIVATHGGLAALRNTDEENKYKQLVSKLEKIESEIAEKFK